MRVVDCVDECSRSNVVIVRPSGVSSNRIWIGGVLDDVTVDALCEWIAGGATPAMPEEVERRVFLRGERRTGTLDVEPTPVELSAGR